MNAVENKARNTTRDGSFGTGTTMSNPGDDKDAGGSILAKPYSTRTQSGGTALNKGRLKPGREVHHGDKPASIKQGSTTPAR
jgi:hypothetical protein